MVSQMIQSKEAFDEEYQDLVEEWRELQKGKKQKKNLLKSDLVAQMNLNIMRSPNWGR